MQLPHWHGAQGLDERARGMAPMVRIDAYDWDFDTSEMAQRAAAYPGEPGTILVSNHSYGYVLGWVQVEDDVWFWTPIYEPGEPLQDGRVGQYNEISADFDRVAWLAPYYQSFVALGNQRTDNPGHSGLTTWDVRAPTTATDGAC